MNRKTPIRVGIDLSGPVNVRDTSLALQIDSAPLRLESGMDDAEILMLLEGYHNRPAIVCLDAPLSYQPGGGYRQADRELAAFLKQRQLVGLGIMAPTMTRMIYLTARGISLAWQLRQMNPEWAILETHPGSVLALSGLDIDVVRLLKRDDAARRAAVDFLRATFDIPERSYSDHDVAAMGCCLGADLFHRQLMHFYRDAEFLHPFPVVG